MSGKCTQSGFTLIELSIVLVIIGLIIGGVLVGQDLIRAADVRATITQLEKYNQAANTFYAKFGYLPGDIPAAPAAQFGFAARGLYAGEGDGNGLIEGATADAPNSNTGLLEGRGETTMFWVDLSAAHLIEGSFTTATSSTTVNVPSLVIDQWMPPARVGGGNYFYVYSAGPAYNNYYGLSAVTNFNGGASISSNVGLSVQEAKSIDAKIDDGLPQSGVVTAQYGNWNILTNVPVWAAGGGVQGANNDAIPGGPTTAATPGSSTTCYDNGNVAGSVQQYSVEISNGLNVNCALSFKFQ